MRLDHTRYRYGRYALIIPVWAGHPRATSVSERWWPIHRHRGLRGVTYSSRSEGPTRVGGRVATYNENTLVL